MKTQRVIESSKRHDVFGNILAVLTLECGHIKEVQVYRVRKHTGKPIPKRARCEICLAKERP